MEALGVEEIPEIVPTEADIEPLPTAARTSSRRSECRENNRFLHIDIARLAA